MPHDTMIDFGVAVDKDISKGNDAFVFAELRGGRGINPGQLGKRLSDDFQLPTAERSTRSDVYSEKLLPSTNSMADPAAPAMS